MATENDSNKKLPKNPGSVSSQKDARYVEVRMSPDGRGSQTYSPYDFGEAKQASFQEQWTPMGSYQSDEAHAKGELHTSLKYESRDYIIGGVCSTVEGSAETYVQDTRKVTVEGDNAKEVGKNDLLAVANQRIKTVLAGTIENTAAGASKAPTYTMSEGDVVEERAGGSFRSLEGDDVCTVKMNYARIIGEGDHATHVQTGNYDVQVTAGKLHLMTSGDELIANSNVKVLLQVGPLAKITMDPSKIKLQVGDASYIEITTAGIKMVGPRIDLN